MSYRCIAFDFDGTLVRSNQVKRIRLYDTVADIPAAAAILDDMHDEGLPGDRYDIFRELCRRLDLRGDLKAEQFVHRYGQLCHQSLLECDEVPGALAALGELKQSERSLYIVSATPQVDLVPIVSGRGLTPFFKAILGRPTGKVEHLEAILRTEQLQPKSLVMIGDGKDDQAAAIAIGCHFIAVTDDPLAPLSGDHVAIDDLRQLQSALAKLENQPGRAREHSKKMRLNP
jgi:phosphoglycolate phosphatase